MSRKSLQKNLSYDDERRLYYVTLPGSGRRRHTKTFRSYEEALRMLNESVVSSSVYPGAFVPLGNGWNGGCGRTSPPAGRQAHSMPIRTLSELTFSPHWERFPFVPSIH